MNDPFDLERFVAAQDQAGTYDAAVAELREGRKRSHWMWFIFPQLAGLGRSSTAQLYGIASLAQACAYLDHPLLGPRLRECVEALLPWQGRPAEQILGPIDALKLRSSLTLFDRVEPRSVFAAGLAALYEGAPDQRTLALLNAEG